MLRAKEYMRLEKKSRKTPFSDRILQKHNIKVATEK